jgi:hypothetical protein
MALTRDAILASDDFGALQAVDMPEWGGAVYLRPISGKEWLDVMQHIGQPEFAPQLLVRCVCDEAGKPLFTVADVEALGKKAWKPFQRLSVAAFKLNGFSEDASDELKNE